MTTLAALLLRAVVPVGYMPNADHSGSIEIVMCSASAAETDASLPDDKTPDPNEDVCAYAMASTSMISTAPTLTVSASIYAFEYAFAASVPSARLAHWTKHAPPTGPPTRSA
ncbi:MAG: hypothetical protein R3C52_09425 [Hyphomonadaceae bacterium]